MKARTETLDAVKVILSVDREVCTVKLVGSAEEKAMDPLSVLLAELHEHAVSGGVGQVDLDLTELAFISANCLKVFVSWFARLPDSSNSGTYRVRILSSTQRAWQRRSLRALVSLAPLRVSVEIAA
jgi:hypothetical protein